MTWLFYKDLRCYGYIVDGADIQEAKTMAEIDDNVKMPTKPERGQQVEKLAHDPNAKLNDGGNASFYAHLPTHYRDRAERWNRRHFNVLFVPTTAAKEKHGWSEQPVIPQLLNYTDAVDLRDYLAKLQSENSITFGFAELREFKLGASQMGGYNYQFDANQYEPEQWGGAHPAGIYDARVASSTVEANSENNGGNLVVEFQTAAGSIKKYYPLWNVKPKAVEGAHKQLAALCHAINRFKIDMNDGGQALVGGQLKIEVGRQKPDEPDNTYMEVKKVFLPDGSLPGKQNQGQQHNQQQGNGGFNQGQGNQGGGFGGQQQNNQQQNNQGGGFGNQGQQQNNGGGFGNQPQGNGGFGNQQQNNQGQQGGGFGGNQGGQGGFGGGQPQGQDQGQNQGQGGGFGGGQGGQGQGGQGGGGFGGGNQGGGFGNQQQGGQQQWQQNGNQGGGDQPSWANT